MSPAHPTLARRLSAWAIGLSLCALGASSLIASGAPQAVSPGDLRQFAAVTSPCPTFTWTQEEGVLGYELALFRAASDGANEPLRSIGLPAGVGSWTPSGGHCLATGGLFGWAIRSVTSRGFSEWSRPLLVSVEPRPEMHDVGEAIRVLERFLEERGEGLEGAAPDAGSEAGADEPAETSSDETDKEIGIEHGALPEGVMISEGEITIQGDTVVTQATDQDTLGAVVCAAGELLIREASDWGCTAPTALPTCAAGFDMIQCYSGDLATVGVGLCRAGLRICNTTGTGYETCVGEVPPTDEICDDADNDCDGGVDEDALDIRTWYPDGDDDGHGDENASPTVACDPPGADYVEDDNTDCDDTMKFTYLGAHEWCDGEDNDCDDTADDGCLGACNPDEQDCLEGCVTTCAGNTSCIADCGTTCSVGSSCDGAFTTLGSCALSAGCLTGSPTWDEVRDCARVSCPTEFLDYGGPECEDGAEEQCGTSDVGACEFGSRTCSGGLWGACVGAVEPTEETCNGINDDCDDQTDESGMLWWPDSDSDGFGEMGGRSVDSCTPPTDHVANDEDCDDSQAAINPDAMEICDGLDNDCSINADGADEPLQDTDCDSPDEDLCDDDLFHCVAGTMACDDKGSALLELCDGLDNDCRGDTDDGVHEPWYNTYCDGDDADSCEEGTQTCSAGMLSCTDTGGNNTEVCDGLDNDCNGSIDEGCSCVSGATQSCGTETGLCTTGSQTCSEAGQWESCSGQGPVAEVCDGLDNNCDGSADECCLTWYLDLDNDGFGGAPFLIECGQPPDTSRVSGDCDDMEGAVFPGAAELCDSLDNDCDNLIDEDGC